MSKPIIEIKGISKKYALSHQSGRQYVALRDKLSPGYLLKKFTGKLPEQANSKEEFWALKDVSFDVQEGEAVGIIGRNGAGKSTLLKVLSKIVAPTDGEIVLRGRVASLLEVGTGFHPELTGRENIYLNGAILGMRRKEIEKKFDEIVDFSGVEKFLDTPVKRYSSGMYVRLAFAVAAHLEPEILIVDEVLAVGDAEFQKKCLGKMEDVAKKEGRTVLFVSHNMAAVQNLCSKGVVLGQGTVRYVGASQEAIDEYLRVNINEITENNIECLIDRSGNQYVIFADVYFENLSGQRLAAIATGQDVVIVFKLKVNHEKVEKVDIGFSVHTNFGETLSVLYSSYQNKSYEDLNSGYHTVRCRISGFPYSPGRYQLKGRLIADGEEADWPKQSIVHFDVEMGDFFETGSTGFSGKTTVLIKGKWQ